MRFVAGRRRPTAAWTTVFVLAVLIVQTGRFRAIEPLPQDSGAAGIWQKLRKLQTTASVLHTTAHPDDEQGGMLALLSRGQGVRTTLLTLNRGESGDNAIGSELFDELGLIRTEELRLAGQYYGLDAQYFTTFADYGYSKRIDEALDKWGREFVLADMVRVIRTERPFVIVSRWQGNARDGHGQHQAAGLLTQEAFRAAADPRRFPDQIADGLRPWQALKLYMGGARSDEAFSIEIDPGVYNPVLGDSYQTFARRGLSLQRSQNSGRFVPTTGSASLYYVRLTVPGTATPATAKPADTTPQNTDGTRPKARSGTSAAAAGTTPAGTTAAGSATAERQSNRGAKPASTLAAALAASPDSAANSSDASSRPASSNAGSSNAASPRAGAAATSATTAGGGTGSGAALAPVVTPMTTGAKEASFFDGIDTTISGIYRTLQLREPVGANTLLTAIEQEVQQAIGAFTVANPAASAPALARGLAATRAAYTKLNADPDVARMLELKEDEFIDALTAALGIEITGVALPSGAVEPTEAGTAAYAPVPTLGPVVAGQTIGITASFATRSAAPIVLRGLDLITPSGWTVKGGNPGLASKLLQNRPAVQRFEVTIGRDAPLTRSGLSRDSLAALHYTVANPADRSRPWPAPLVQVRAEYEIEGLYVEITRPIARRENTAPYGYTMRELAIVPPITVNMTPAQVILPLGGSQKPVTLTVDVTNHQPREASGAVALTLPQDWRADPATQPFTLTSGQSARVTFSVSAPSVKPEVYRIGATASSGGRTFSEGFNEITHRDLETRYFYRPATAAVQVVNVSIAPNLRVGYVMGVGDEIPAAIAQLGATVQLLDAQALASAPLDRFDAIVLGTRAYGVRPDLRAANPRLLDYAKNGGNLIVLYNTPEFDPQTQAPFSAKLPPNAEEVSEEDAAVRILLSEHPLFTRPNRITQADFSGWVEQRGTKFWSEWSPAYTPMLESHDQGQAPQRGGWLYAKYGKGHYSYVAYAFHRQLPYGVPGAYRLMANLLSLGKS